MTDTATKNTTDAPASLSGLLVTLFGLMLEQLNARAAFFHDVVIELANMGRRDTPQFRALIGHLDMLETNGEAIEQTVARLFENFGDMIPPDVREPLRQCLDKVKAARAASDHADTDRPAGWPHLPGGPLSGVLQKDTDGRQASPPSINLAVMSPTGRAGMLCGISDETGEVEIQFDDGTSEWFEAGEVADLDSGTPIDFERLGDSAA